MSDVTQSDDKPRGATIREASKLRATLGSEPSSGYAFHDQVRVDRVERTRTPRVDVVAPQAASHAPRERSFARTLAGGMTLQEALAARELRIEPPAANDPNQSGPQLSWPPLPQVPQDLVGSVDDEQPASAPNAFAEREPSSVGNTLKKVSSKPPAVPQGAAIWEALPSVAVLGELSASLPTPSLPTRSASVPPGASVTPSVKPSPAATPPAAESGRQSRPGPAAYRPSAAELEADYRSSYADVRLIKYEALVERNAWEQVSEELARERDLSPALRLLRVVAQRETLKGADQKQTAKLTQDTIAAVAQLLQVPEASPTALVIGKRLLRKNPGWVPKQTPNAGLSIGVLLGGIGAGAGVGWLVTTFLL